MLKNVLIICKSYKDLGLIDTLSSESAMNIIIASDDIDVLRIANSNERVFSTTYITQMVSIYEIVDDVLRFRETINKWLTTLSFHDVNYVVEWEKHAEGGTTTQLINDAIFSILAWQKILSENNISWILQKKGYLEDIEDQLLIEVAEHLKIPMKIIKPIGFNLLYKLDIKRIKRKIFNKEISLYLPNNLILLYKRSLLYINAVVGSLIRVIFSNHKSDESEITFLLGSSSLKHVDSKTRVMKQFQVESNYIPIALCWRSSQGAKVIKEMGLKSENLEHWLPVSKIFNVVFKHNAIKKLLKNEFEQNYPRNKLRFNGISLSNVLQPKIINFFKYEFIARLALDEALRNYFSKNSPVAVNVWGHVLPLGYFSIKILTEERSTLSKSIQKPFLFNFGQGLNPGDIYKDGEVDTKQYIDIMFVHGLLDKELEERSSDPKIKFVTMGFPKEPIIKETKLIYSKEQSLKFLKLSRSGYFTILYVSTAGLQGIFTLLENELILNALFRFCVANDQITLIIKMHPSEDPALVNGLYDKYNKPRNITIVNGNELPNHSINASDLVITKLSTIGIEAMIFKKPVVSIALDGEIKFQKWLDDGVEKFESTDNLVSFLDKLITNSEYFQRWKKRRLSKQDIYLSKKIQSSKYTYEEIIVKNVIRGIKTSHKPLGANLH